MSEKNTFGDWFLKKVEECISKETECNEIEETAEITKQYDDEFWNDFINGIPPEILSEGYLMHMNNYNNQNSELIPHRPPRVSVRWKKQLKRKSRKRHRQRKKSRH